MECRVDLVEARLRGIAAVLGRVVVLEVSPRGWFSIVVDGVRWLERRALNEAIEDAEAAVSRKMDEPAGEEGETGVSEVRAQEEQP